MGIRQAAELLGVSDDTVRGWIDNDALIAGQDDSGRTVIAGDVLADFWRGRQRTGSPKSSDLCGDAAVGELHGGYRKRFKEIMSLSRAGRATPSSNQRTERP
jgi:excisionase family DNA binding protein